MYTEKPRSEAMRKIPGNEHFGDSIEYTTIVKHYFGRNSAASNLPPPALAPENIECGSWDTFNISNIKDLESVPGALFFPCFSGICSSPAESLKSQYHLQVVVARAVVSKALLELMLFAALGLSVTDFGTVRL